MTSLKRVLATQRPMHRRNFIQENVRRLRDMQLCWQNKNEEQAKPQNCSKFRNVSPRVPLHTVDTVLKDKELNCIELATDAGVSKSLSSKAVAVTTHAVPATKSVSSSTCKSTLAYSRQSSARKSQEAVHRSPRGSVSSKPNTSNSDRAIVSVSSDATITDSASSASAPQTLNGSTSRGCQTVDDSNLDTLYNEGVIKYPSSIQAPKWVKPIRKNVPTRDMGLQTEDISKKNRRVKSHVNMRRAAQGDMKSTRQSLNARSPSGSPSDDDYDNEKKAVNYSRLNMGDRQTPGSSWDSLKPGKNVKKVVPKQAKTKQQEEEKAEEPACNIDDPACPPGHMPLPDRDRKETLKMLKKSHGDLIRELNLMPVKSDTLKMHQRKTELEKQLSKLEDGIKVFSRPKVYVKLGI